MTDGGGRRDGGMAEGMPAIQQKTFGSVSIMPDVAKENASCGLQTNMGGGTALTAAAAWRAI